MSLSKVLPFVFVCTLYSAAEAAEPPKEDGASIARNAAWIAQLNASDPAKSLAARNALVVLPLSELRPVLPEILKLVKDGSWQHDDAAAVVRVLGPDCMDAVPIFFKAVREEKDAVRRRTLVRLVSLLGTSAAKELPALRAIAARDPDAEVRKEAGKTMARVGIPDARLDEALRLLKLRSYKDTDEAKAAQVAIDLVQDNWGVRCDLIQELVRLGVDIGAKHDPPSDGNTGEFLSYGFSLLRIGTPVIMEAIEGEDGKRRKAGLVILVWSASSQNPSAWYATKLMGELLNSKNAEVRRDVAVAIGNARARMLPGSAPRAAISELLPALGECAAKDSDESVRKAATEALKVFTTVNWRPPEGGREEIAKNALCLLGCAAT